MKVKINKCQHIILLGGGDVLFSVACWLKQNAVSCYVLTAPRQADEKLAGGMNLSESLTRQDISFSVHSKWQEAVSGGVFNDIEGSAAFSFGAAWLFKQEDIDNIFKNKLFNFHGTRLPTNRGGGGFSWQIMNGNKFGFCVMHQIDGGIDTGDIYAVEEFLFPASCRIPRDFIALYQENNTKFAIGIIDRLLKGDCEFQISSQPEYLSQYWPRLNTKTNAWINWAYDIHDLERFICAFDRPYPGARTFINEQEVSLHSVMIDLNDRGFHPFQYGLVYRKTDDYLCVAANGGTLLVCELEDLTGTSILEKIRVGDRFFTAADQYDALAKRVVYTPNGLKE